METFSLRKSPVEFPTVAYEDAIKCAYVLVAEEHDDIRFLLKTVLEKEPGVKVVEAPNGEIAAALTMSLRIDMILIERDLALLDGYSVTKRLREHESFSHLPIIMMSECSDSSARAKAFDSGCDDYVVKPFPMSLLSTLVQRHVMANTSPSDAHRNAA
jgi:DNA-binding response OmpR family regulator